jgi:DNA-binding NarL/FixJ family response regulator
MGVPPVQFATTGDGIRLAFRCFGSGSAILFASNIWGDASFYRVDPDVQVTTDRLVESGWSVIRYDIRGMGLSDRDRVDFSLDARVRDVGTIADHLELRVFAIAGMDGAGATAAAYAAVHSHRVSALVLLNAWESGERRYVSNPPARSLAGTEPMAQEEWEYFTLTLGNLVTHFKDAGLAGMLAEQYRASTSPETFSAYRRELRQIDITEHATRIGVPTLVLRDRLFAFSSLELSRQLAARIPASELLEVDGPTEAAETIDSFLRSVTVDANRDWSRLPGRRAEPGLGEAAALGAHLTRREIEILRLIALGHTNKEICADLFLSVRTVGRHITNIYAKIDARNRAEATAYAIHHRLN